MSFTYRISRSRKWEKDMVCPVSIAHSVQAIGVRRERIRRNSRSREIININMIFVSTLPSRWILRCWHNAVGGGGISENESALMTKTITITIVIIIITIIIIIIYHAPGVCCDESQFRNDAVMWFRWRRRRRRRHSVLNNIAVVNISEYGDVRELMKITTVTVSVCPAVKSVARSLALSPIPLCMHNTCVKH